VGNLLFWLGIGAAQTAADEKGQACRSSASCNWGGTRAHRVILWRRNNSVASRVKRTFSERRLQNRINEYARQHGLGAGPRRDGVPCQCRDAAIGYGEQNPDVAMAR
jgi:hypothetical protein